MDLGEIGGAVDAYATQFWLLVLPLADFLTLHSLGPATLMACIAMAISTLAGIVRGTSSAEARLTWGLIGVGLMGSYLIWRVAAFRAALVVPSAPAGGGEGGTAGAVAATAQWATDLASSVIVLVGAIVTTLVVAIFLLKTRYSALLVVGMLVASLIYDIISGWALTGYAVAVLVLVSVVWYWATRVRQGSQMQ